MLFLLPKEELQKMAEILDILKGVQNQLNFMQVQLGSGTGAGRPSTAAPSDISTKIPGSASFDPKQLQSIEQRLEDLTEQLGKTNENMNNLIEQVSKLSASKIEQADERINQVTRLLEKGLALTEMGAQLTEIKDRMEEIIIELASAAKQVSNP